MTPDRYAQCDDTCTVDCGACKGAGRPVPVLPEVAVETVARAMAASDGNDFGTTVLRSHYRRLAAAAIAAMPPSPAEEAVKRVEALVDVAGELDDLGMGFGMAAVGDSERGDLRSFEFNESISNTLRDFADRIRGALAFPAPAPQDGAR